MSTSIVKPELLAPAGNMEKLRAAVIYGADAIYLGGENFSLRAVEFTHAPGKIYEEHLNLVNKYR